MKTTMHTRAHTLHTHSSERPENSTVAVVGLGYVGLPLAELATKKGISVIGYDIDEGKIARAREMFAASTDSRELRRAATYIVCVPTPVSEDREPDLKPLVSATEAIARHLKTDDLVIIESTINPGVCEEVVLPILERNGFKVEVDFYLAHCPERINPGDTYWNVRTIPRVLGAAGPRSLKRAEILYRSIIDGDIKLMRSLKEAEAVKMVENTFRDVNIAFVNELAMSFDRAGIDLMNVIQGASTKPFAFMPHFPGAGVGGHCIPVDPYYLIRYGAENGFEHHFLKTARRINDKMPSYAVSILDRALRTKGKQLERSTIALLGLAYKRDVDDERESPARSIQKILKKRGAVVRTFDPYVPAKSSAPSLEAALESVDAALIATDHSQFRSLTPFDFMRSGVSVVVDGRNCLNKDEFIESGVAYYGIGRGSV